VTPELETALLALLNAAKTWEQYADESTSPTARAADRRLCMAIRAANTVLDCAPAPAAVAWAGSSPEAFAAAAALLPPVAGPEAAAPVPLGKITRTVSPPPPIEATAFRETDIIPHVSDNCPECGQWLYFQRGNRALLFCMSSACPCYAPPVGR
jgi:hypothetical protein